MTKEDKTWSELGLSAELLKLIEDAGYQKPTLVQQQSIPEIIQGHDVLASSQTGSGKTASFVLPAIERFKNKNGTYILALSPTREIAQQTGAVFEQFCQSFGMKVAVCIGGVSISAEKELLAGSPHIIVATPGRLCDHLERGNVWLDFIECLIFDEADRMLEMGFAKQIDLITEQIPKSRQTLMFSATYSPAVEKLARAALREPKEVVIAKTATTTPQIDQRLFWISEDKKIRELLRLLKIESGTTFVFVNAKERAYQVWRLLNNNGFDSATYIHSDLTQDAREQAVADFKSGKYRVIIATDVMGRGIDVDDVGQVVNYDVPREPEDYIHRIGRTGRRGLKGHASTFAIPGKDDRYIKAIEKLRGVPAPDYKKSLPENGPRKSAPKRDSRPKTPRTQEVKPQVATVSTPVVNEVKKIGFFKKIFRFFFVFSILVTGAFAMDGHDVIYGDDNRLDAFAVTNSAFFEASRATAAMVPNIRIHMAGDTAVFNSSSLVERGICKEERFSHQPTTSMCSGFLVAENIIVTAGHCIRNDADCKINRWVFDYKVESDEQLKVKVPRENVYECKRVITTKWIRNEESSDYAVIELKKKVKDRRPLSIRKSGVIEVGAPLVVMGYPSGLPLKIADGANVRSVSDHFFVANLDTFAGNSGSAVLNVSSGEVEGILVRGDTDYIEDSDRQCKVVNKCASEGCRGEDVQLITEIAELRDILSL